MAEPRIQYAKTSDGVNIAFWTLGEGPPLVQMPRLPYGHTQMEWQIPDFRGWYELLASRRMLVRYDGRGCGLSDRDAIDFSIEAQTLDLNAVADRLGLERFALFGIGTAGPAAISYAARQPGRVSHLLLWCAYARAADFFDSPRVQSLLGILDDDWELFTETTAQFSYGWSGAASAHRYAAFLREGVTQSAASEAYRAFAGIDVTDLLPRIGSPTQVMHARQVPYPPLDAARAIASHIPDARLAVLEGESLGPWVGDMEAAARAIDEFLDDGKEAARSGLAREDIHTILFTDMEGSTTLTQRLGDADAQEILRTHNSIVREALTAHSGTETKHTGDGIMASFTSASAALEAAVAIQKALADHNEGNADTAIRVRIGLNAGEPVAEDEDLFGTAVQLAARVCDKAEPGQILASNVVQELAAGKGFTFVDNGEATLKGFEKPMRLHEVRWHD